MLQQTMWIVVYSYQIAILMQSLKKLMVYFENLIKYFENETR